MKVIGLTGGIAVGKSEIAKIFRSQNIPVFDADAAVHELYQNGLAAKHLKPIFPSAVDGKNVDRKKLSEILTQQPAKLKDLEEVIHPLVRQAETEFISQAQRQNTPIVIIDSPLLMETNHDKDMDATILVAADTLIQIARATQRPNMTQEKLNFIMSKQMPQNEKRARCNFIIENNGSLKDLESQTLRIIAKLQEI